MNNAKDYYNLHSAGYVSKWDLSLGLKKPANYYRLQIINSIIEMAHIETVDKVVEIGCGTGLVLDELLKICRPIYGTDISIEMLQRVKDSLLKDKKVSIVDNLNDVLNNGGSDIFLMQNDLLGLNLPKNYFNKIISMEVLRYIDDVPKSLQNVKNIMKQESIFVFTVTNLWSFSLFPIKYSIRKLFHRINKKDELLQYFVTEKGIKREIANAGLTLVSFKKLNMLSFNPLIERLVKTDIQAQKIMRWDRVLSKVPILNNFFDTFILAVKLDKHQDL